MAPAKVNQPCAESPRLDVLQATELRGIVLVMTASLMTRMTAAMSSRYSSAPADIALAEFE
jgi:hypothetical protein